MADRLVKEYGNLRTVTWAITSDTSYLESTFDVDAHLLWEVLQEHGLHRNEHSDDAGPLLLPERWKDKLWPDMRNIDIDASAYDVKWTEEHEVSEQASLNAVTDDGETS